MNTSSTLSLGHTELFLRHFDAENGNSSTWWSKQEIFDLVKVGWEQRKPGLGEGTRLDRKVVVPIHDVRHFFCPPRIKPVLGLPICARIVARQKGEDPYVETFVTFEDAVKYGFRPIPAVKVEIVCYSAAALLENGGTNETGADWSTVALLCSERDGELMTPLTMARNHLEKVGGTKPAVEYTSNEWANAIWEHSINRGIKVSRP